MAAACALLVAASDGRSARAAATANSVTFQDSTGEDAAAPDITSVTVANDDQATLTFTVNVSNRPTLTGDMAFLVLIDSDANPSTGSADFGGADYVIELDGPFGGRSAGAALFRWDGTDFTSSGVSQSTLIFSYANGPTIRVNTSELGGTQRFGVAVIAISGIVIVSDEPDFSNVRVDNAPDRGWHTYDVRITPPRLVLGNGGTRPARATAGKLFTQIVTVARSDGAALAGGTATCRATVGTTRVAARAALAGGRATCTFRIPATGKGKLTRITVSVSAGGLSASRAFSARVR